MRDADAAILTELAARDEDAQRLARLDPSQRERLAWLRAKCEPAVDLSCYPPDPSGLRCLTDAELEEYGGLLGVEPPRADRLDVAGELACSDPGPAGRVALIGPCGASESAGASRG